MNPRQRRGWVDHVQHVFRVSQRRACRGLRVARSTCRYVCRKRADEAAIIGRMTEIAEVRVRYGYRRIHVLMAREGWKINHKRLYRLYTQTGLRGADEATAATRQRGTPCRAATSRTAG